MAAARQPGKRAGHLLPYVPHSRPALGPAEASAVAAVLASGHISQGPEVAALEADAACRVGIPVADAAHGRHAVAVSSGSAALYVALRALGIAAGDEVLVPAYACASLDRAVRLCGATSRWIDCDPETLNPDPEHARRLQNHRAVACIVPHLFGLPAHIDAFRDLGVPIVEDCAQTLGVEVDGRPVGSAGDVTVLSFYATKLVAAGEGGMVVARDAQVAARARALRDCERPDAADGSLNFKLSDLHAALARTQLARLDEFLGRRAELARRYFEALGIADVDLPGAPEGVQHAFFRFVVRLRRHDVDDLIARCEQRALACRRPVGRLMAQADLDALPGCREAWQRALSIPLYPALTDTEADLVPRRFIEALGGRQ